jgi:hypothetical protein
LDFATVILLQSKVVRLGSNPNLEDQVSVFMSSSDRVAQLYPQTPGSLFVAFYDSQWYSGGILTRLHTGKIPVYFTVIYQLKCPVFVTDFLTTIYINYELFYYIIYLHKDCNYT